MTNDETKLDDIALDNLNEIKVPETTEEKKEEDIQSLPANNDNVVRTGWDRFKTKCKRHTLSLVIIIFILIAAIIGTLMAFSMGTRYVKSFNVDQCTAVKETCEQQQNKWQQLHELELKEKVIHIISVKRMYLADGNFDHYYLFYPIVLGILIICKFIHPYITCLLEICIY